MIEINNLTSFAVDKKLFTGIAKKVLKGENRGREKISLAFVSKKEMQKLNKKFRGKNKPTDVLSFNNIILESLGEIVICPEVVKENAKKNSVSVKQEIIKVFAHGILHLLGYDHEKAKEAEIMEKKQDFYLSKFNL